MTAALPENVRQMRGTARADRQVRRPQPVRGVPEPPTFLDREAKAEWKRITPELHRLGLLALVDRAVLSLYCDAWSKWVDAAKELASAKLIVDDKAHTGIKKHPAWQVYREAGTICAGYQAKLGLNPADRNRMHAPEVDEADASDILD